MKVLRFRTIMPAVLLSFVLLLCAMPASAALATGGGDSIAVSGNCGPLGDEAAVQWRLYSNGALVISGAGPMMSVLDDDNMAWAEYDAYIRTVIVEEGVTTLATDAISAQTVWLGDRWNSFDNLVAIKLPSTLEFLGSYAIYGLKSLHTLVFAGDIPPLLSPFSLNYANNGDLLTIYSPVAAVTDYAGLIFPSLPANMADAWSFTGFLDVADVMYLVNPATWYSDDIVWPGVGVGAPGSPPGNGGGDDDDDDDEPSGGDRRGYDRRGEGRDEGGHVPVSMNIADNPNVGTSASLVHGRSGATVPTTEQQLNANTGAQQAQPDADGDIVSVYANIPPLYNAVDELMQATAVTEASSASHGAASRPDDEPANSTSPIIWVAIALGILSTGALLTTAYFLTGRRL